MADRIESTGAELVPCTSTLPVADNDWPADPIAAASLFLDDAVRTLPQLRAIHDEDPVDLHLYDIGAYAARALAEAQGRPLVQLSPTFVGWDGYQQEAAAHLRKLPGADAYRDRFTRWLADCGATTTDVDTFSGPPARPGPRPDPASHAAARRSSRHRHGDLRRPCFDTRADTDGWTRPAAADHVLLISLGSAYTRQPAFYRWGRAREAASTLDELALESAKRPYDLRHAGISFRLASGVDPAECARRAGQSIPMPTP